MTPRIPSLAEIEETVARMENRYHRHPRFADYVRLKERFDADLSDARDRALAKSAALMLISMRTGAKRTRD